MTAKWSLTEVECSKAVVDFGQNVDISWYGILSYLVVGWLWYLTKVACGQEDVVSLSRIMTFLGMGY